MIDTFDLGPGRRVLDLGCGPGLYARRLEAAGADVTGVDLSRVSIGPSTEKGNGTTSNASTLLLTEMERGPKSPRLLD